MAEQLADLNNEDRLRLVRFLCSFAWADLAVSGSERAYLAKIIDRLELRGRARAEAESWLKVPPPPEDIDPTDIPREHRQVFLTHVLQMMGADGQVDEREVENFQLLERLLR